MADPEHIRQIEQGRDHWNAWRHEHPQIQPNLQGANLSRANLSRANLSRANLSEAILSEAILYRADLDSADLSEAILSRAKLMEAELGEANLSGADLSGADLSGADLMEADLSGANLSRADLTIADLVGADLSGADLVGADLIGAKLNGADLSEANLSRADLSEANLSDANLSEANLSYVKIERTSIAKVDLRTVKGLTTIHHHGPSHLELFSVQLPQDGSALHFLRGVGVPDEWIDYYRASSMHPVQYHSCFLSYSSKDEMLAKRLHADLQAEGVRCWFAPEDLKIGEKFRTRIDEAIHLQDKLLLLLSEHSIESEWVEDEVEAAIEKEHRQKRDVLFPVRLDRTVMETTQAWAATLRRTRTIGDFSKWTEPEAYQRAFTRLLRDLKQ